MVNLLVQIPRKAITDKDTLIFTRRIERWQTEYAEHAKKAGIPFLRGTVLFSVEGYDSDPRELYEIPEVQQWFRELLRKVPYLFYYVDPDPAHQQYSFIIPMYVKFTSIPGEGVQVESDSLVAFVRTTGDNVREFARRIGDEPDEAGAMFLDGLQAAWSL